jgi:hypothetical protein
MKAVGAQMTFISVLKFLMQELEKIILINIGTNVKALGMVSLNYS